MAAAPRLAEPPRHVPLSLQVRLLAERDVTGASLFFLVAAVMLFGAMHAAPSVRVILVVIGGGLALFSLQAVLATTLRVARRLRNMREGYLSAGRIVACRFTWESAKAERPYREFLENWTTIYGRSTTGKMMGCLTTAVIVIFVAPLVLGMLLLIGAAVYTVLADPARTDVDFMLIAKMAGAVALFVVVLLWTLSARKRAVVDEVEGYMEWRKLRRPGEHDAYDDEARALVADAKARGVEISLKEPLPGDPAGIELVCRVEYAIMGRPQTASARAPLCNRLDPAGVERLVFVPSRPAHVELLAALPPDARTDEHGRWQPLPAAAPATFLAVTAVLALAALLLLGWNIAGLLDR